MPVTFTVTVANADGCEDHTRVVTCKDPENASRTAGHLAHVLDEAWEWEQDQPQQHFTLISILPWVDEEKGFQDPKD